MNGYSEPQLLRRTGTARIWFMDHKQNIDDNSTSAQSNFTNKSFDILSEKECLLLLSEETLGRLCITGDFPSIFPVNYVVLNSEIIIATSQGTKLQAAENNAPVAFEVDRIDYATKTGWSVMIIGNVSEVKDSAVVEKAKALNLQPWAPGDKRNFIRIPIHFISGRAIRSTQQLPSKYSAISA